MPFAGVSPPGGIPCPAGGVPAGSYLVAGNWIDSHDNAVAGAAPTIIGSYPPEALSNTFVYDNTPPDTLITSGPANGGHISSTSATFTFTSTESPSTFTCKLDNGSTAACNTGSATYGNLGQGQHTFTVFARDAAGNVDPSPAIRTWTVDTMAPTIAAHGNIVADPTGPGGANVTYTAPTTGDAIDGQGVATCVPGSGSLFPIGTTTVKCDATDAAGNHAAQTQFTVTVRTPYAVKQDVRAAIATLRAAATAKSDKDKLDDALKHLDNALNASWTNQSHPSDKDGDKVFNEEKEVVKKLAELVKDKKSTNPTDMALMALIARLVQVDRVLALISISEQTDPKKVAKAQDEIAKGDAERDKDTPDHADNAIDHYKNAWKKS